MKHLLLVPALLLAFACQSAQVTIDGVQPTMTADAVAAIVTSRLESNEKLVGTRVATIRVLKIVATTGDRVGHFEPGAGDQDPPMSGVVWIVRAQGTFFNPRSGINPDAMLAGSGYFVLADSDGSILGTGTP